MWRYKTSGIPDRLFRRRDGIPITTAEVRAVVISKLRLTPDVTIFDVGTGSGSVAVEIALIASQGQVYALERNSEAIKLVNENIIKFGINNIQVVTGDAAKTIPELPAAQRIFIGGSGGNLDNILKQCHRKLESGGIMVATSVTLNTAPMIDNFMEENRYQDVEMVSLNLARITKTGQVNLWRANNPVQIISGIKR